ncbi:MAG: hypothetical protein J0H42_09990 [Rhizobiales bacterium]|nr:hypothetical protein [Hyphomicrobiales bacterium]
MLPGFRFLFAATVLSMSVLIFGLGAAALLRAAHEQFASIPSRRAPPEPVFSRQNEPPPTLALLRVEPDVTEKLPDVAEKAPDNVALTTIPEAAAPVAQAPEEPAVPEKLAALKSEEPVPAETMKPDIPAVEPTPAIQAAAPETPIANEEVKLAAIAEAPPVTVALSPPAEPVAEAPSLAGNLAATRIATLGGPPVTIEETVAVKTTSAKPKSHSIHRKRAQRSKERRRIAAARRALLARQIAAQHQADPFAPITVRGRQ